MKKKTYIWLGIGCAVICLLLVIGTVVLGGAFIKWVSEEPENITVNLQAPIEITQGEEFLIEVEVTNSALESQEINSIDIDLSYLDGVIVSSVEPEYSYFSEYDFPESFHSYEFLQEIPAKDSLVVKFYAKALKAGDYSGGIDICINSVTNCLEKYIRTVISEEK